MAKVTIGDKEYNVKELTFETLERVWPYIAQIQDSIRRAQEGKPDQSPTTIMAHGVATIALCVAQDDPELAKFYDDPQYSGLSDEEKQGLVIAHVKRRITSRQTQGLEPLINEIMAEAGFKAEPAQPGEPEATEEESPSTETGTPSSPSSSQPDAKEEAGTE